MLSRSDGDIERSLRVFNTGRGSSDGRRLDVGTEEIVELLPGDVYGPLVDDPLLTSLQRLRSRTVSQTDLLIRPDGLDLLSVGHTDIGVTTEFSPVLSALDVQLGEGLVDGFGEASDLLGRVAGCDSEAETFLAASDGGVVDSLDVDVVLGEQVVGGSLGECGVTDEDGNDVRGTGDNGDVECFQTRLEITDVDLFELTITVVLALVRDTGASTSHVDGRERGSEDEAGCIGADHVDHVSRTSDIATDCAVSLSESA